MNLGGKKRSKFLRVGIKKKWFISKLVEGQRAGLFKMASDFKVPEGNPALAGLLAIMRHISLLSCGGGVCYFSEALFPRPRCALRKASRGFMESGYPADACGAICLSSRALGRLSLKI